jgi:hypothetical protein
MEKILQNTSEKEELLGRRRSLEKNSRKNQCRGIRVEM